MKNKLYLLLSSLVLFSLLLSACGSPAATESTAPIETEAPVATEAPTEIQTEAPTATPEPAGPLTVLIDNDEGPITPANFNTFIGGWIVGWVYDSLYIRTPELEPIPALATSATP